MGKAVGSVLGFSQPEKPKPAPEPQKTMIDPNRGAQIAAANQKKRLQAAAAGASNFRIDLNKVDENSTRSGVTV